MKQTGRANLAVTVILAAFLAPVMTSADGVDSGLRGSSQWDKDALAADKCAMLAWRAETNAESRLRWGWEVKLAPRRGSPEMFAALQSNAYRTDIPA